MEATKLTLENGTNISLKAKTIHCVQTGIPVCDISDAEGIKKLNALLTSGQLVAEGQAHKLFLSEKCKEQLLNEAAWRQSVYSTTLSTPLEWWTKSQGLWVKNLGSEVGEHNKAVLKDCRVGCPKEHCYSGSENRQYRALRAAKAKRAPKVAAVDLAAPKVTVETLASPKVKQLEVTAHSVAMELGLDPNEVDFSEMWPTPEESGGRGGGHQKYLARMASDFDLGSDEAKQLWGRNRRFLADQSKGKAVTWPDPLKVLQDFHGVQAPKEPEQTKQAKKPSIQWTDKSPKQSTKSNGSTIVAVSPTALKAVLAGVEGAEIVSVADDGKFNVRL